MSGVLPLLMHLVEGPAPLPRSVGENPPEDVAADQDGQEAEPPPPPALGVPERPFRSRYAPGPSLRLGVLALRPSVSYDTREYFTGVCNGDADFRPGADLPRMAPGMIFSLDLGPVRGDGDPFRRRLGSGMVRRRPSGVVRRIKQCAQDGLLFFPNHARRVMNDDDFHRRPRDGPRLRPARGFDLPSAFPRTLASEPAALLSSTFSSAANLPVASPGPSVAMLRRAEDGRAAGI